MDSLKIISQNFQRVRPDHNKVAQVLKDTDILMAQEILWPKNKNELKQKLEKIYNCKIMQFICILESQVVKCSMGSFYTQRF